MKQLHLYDLMLETKLKHLPASLNHLVYYNVRLKIAFNSVLEVVKLFWWMLSTPMGVLTCTTNTLQKQYELHPSPAKC